MPELPDVEVFKRYLDRTCKGRTIEKVVVNDPKLLAHMSAAAFSAKLKGRRLVSSRRYGKHLLVKLAPSGWLTLHFGMNGALAHLRDGQAEPRYDRVRLDFADGHHLAYINPRRIGAVGLVDDADAFITAEKLGPDALDPRFDFAAFDRALSGRRGDIKSVLMDQTVMAGIGNIYSDEILFQAGIYPQTRTDRLDAQTRRRLYRQIKRVLKTAVERGAGAELAPDNLPRSFLLPHREKGGRCPRCGGELGTIKSSGRTAYYCSHCQGRTG